MKTITLIVALGAFVLPATVEAQAADPTKRYIDAGFAAMDTDKNGQVSRAEFDKFMRARLARQAQKFDAAFAGLDANKDGKISKAEAAKIPELADNFAEVDRNGDGGIDKQELRVAAAQAQMQDATGN